MKINDSLKNRMYSKDDIDELRFYQIPKALIENPKYKNVSMAAKLMYAIMRDRQYLSQKNNWADEEGHIFFYFDCRSLAKLCNVSTSTINRYKKELITAQLLIDVRQGQGKPNRMYILRPESIDNTMNSHNDYTRVAESATLDYLKRLTNDTEYNETEFNDTDIIHLPEEDDFVSIYKEIFKAYKGTEHMRVKRRDYYYILDCIEEIKNYDVTKEEWGKAVTKHFETLPESNNGNILAFLRASKRYFDIDLAD